jgi:hypothetical protein
VNRINVKTKYSNEIGIVEKTAYKNGVIAILVSSVEGEPLLTASVNIPEEADKLKEDETFIKNWSENEGILKCLQDEGVIGPVLFEVSTGFVKAQAVKVLI